MDVINYLAANIFLRILAMKYIISTALMREKPVRSPIVPPIADSWSTNLAARSCNQYLLLLGYDHFYGFTLLIRSNVDAENDI